MICFTEEFEGGNNPLNLSDEEYAEFQEKIKMALIANLEAEQEKEEEDIDLTEKYMDCTPIYKYMCVFKDDIAIAQIQFLHSYEENDIIRNDVIQKATQILAEYAMSNMKEKTGQVLLAFRMCDDKFGDVLEIAPS